MRVLSSARVGAIFDEADPSVIHARAQRLDRASRLALAAAQRAAVGQGTEDCGVFVLTRYGAIAANSEHWQRFLAAGILGVSPLVFPATVPSAAAAEIALALQAMGPSVTLCGGAERVADLWQIAEDALRAGDCKHVMIGAVDGWHPALAHFDLREAEIDGACFALATAGEGPSPRVSAHASVVRAFARLLEE